MTRKLVLTNYSYIHQWNNKHHPKTGKCVQCDTEGKRTEWALIHGKEHARGVENYKELCKKCHIAYDMTPEWKQKTIDNAWKNNPRYGTVVANVPCKSCGTDFLPVRKSNTYCSLKCLGRRNSKRLLSNPTKQDEKGRFCALNKK